MLYRKHKIYIECQSNSLNLKLIILLFNCRKKLVTLAQIHLCLECMLLIETHLKCPIESLQSLFALVCKQFVSVQSPLQHYSELCNQIFTFTTTLSNIGTNKLNKMYI